jgi:hypothetical protein
MIFFMVKFNANMLNVKINLSPILLNRRYSKVKIALHDYNKNQGNKDFKPKDNYVKVLVEDPYNNRNIILNVTKKQKGIYV